VKITGEVKVGLLTLVCGLILYFGFNFLKGMDFFDPTTTYHVVYGKVEGLKVSNPVYVNGLSVGRVSGISILQSRGNQLLVSLDVQDDLKLGQGSLASLADDGLLGGKKIDLIIKSSDKILAEGDTLQAQTISGLTDQLAAKASPVMASLDTTLANLNRLIVEYQGMSSEVKKIMANTAQATGQASGIMADNRSQLAATMANVQKLTSSLTETEKSLKPLLGKVNTFADSLNALQLAGTVAKANQTVASLNQTLAAINKGQGSLGKLVYNDSLYANLNRTVVSLDSLFTDLKARPKRYVHFSLFGRKAK
jgi:phospholipid/cholesterol/gamma-HCH transport system substrate-binding protein